MTRSSGFPAVSILVLVAAVIGGGGYFFFQDMDGPEIELTPRADRVSSHQDLTVSAWDETSPLKSITLTVRRGGRVKTFLEQTFDGGAQKQTIQFTLKDADLSEGAFDLEIRAVDGSFAGFGKGNATTRSYALRLDDTPPSLSIRTQPPYVRRGGAACIVFTPSKALKEAGVLVGERYFPAFRQENGDYICFFAYPYYLETQDFQPQLTALDMADNRAQVRVPVYRVNRKFRTDTVEISDRFLNAKNPEFSAMVPGDMTPIERFIRVTDEVRAANAATLLEIGRRTADAMLWQDAFQRQPGASRAGFADHRIYVYNRETLGVESTHLGLDIASTVNSPVAAANSGTVVYADYLGIYGNLVVIDHGLGLQSLYSHLSRIDATVGQELKKGDLLGLTGETGVAFGDHLHFGIAISGLEVTPVEWLDGRWIIDTISSRITAAGGTAPAVTPPAPPPPPSGRDRRR
jgi:murein DD-endopeptidase MepM/ murein hydrolase activator NlpD